jgi:hypothetical protein
VDLTKRLYLLFEASGVSVIRMGLQATESLSLTGGLVAGPFHPAFGHMVHAAIFFDSAVRAIEGEETVGDTVTLAAHPKDVSKVRGLKNRNVLELTKRFGLRELRISANPALPLNTLEVVREETACTSQSSF